MKILFRWLLMGVLVFGFVGCGGGDTATSYCSDLTLGGYSDWRLPSVKELLFIVDN